MDLGKLDFTVQNSSFSMNYGSPGPATGGRTQSSRAVRGVCARGRRVSGEPPPAPPPGQRKDVGSLEKPDGSCPEKRDLGSGWEPLPPRPGVAPTPEPAGAAAAAAANTHRVRRWAGSPGTRTAAPPRCRGGVSARHTPSGPPPGPRLGAPRRRRRPRLHGQGKRLRGD